MPLLKRYTYCTTLVFWDSEGGAKNDWTGKED